MWTCTSLGASYFSHMMFIVGQMNLNMSELEQAQEMSGHEEYLRNIWRTLNVGVSGYITAQELGQVCDHIGMEMNKNVSNIQCL